MSITKHSLEGIDISVVSEGVGPPVFVLGGPWFGHFYLSQLHDVLARRFQVISYDPRGSGDSSPLTQDQITLAGHLQDLENLRETLNIGRMNLLGHSMGALVCLLYAADHPAQMGSLVLLNPGPPFDQELQLALHHAFTSGHTPQDKARLEELESSPGFTSRDPATHEEYFKVLYSPFFMDRANLAQLGFAFTSTTAQYALEAEEHLLEEVLAQQPAARLAVIECPTLVVHAEHDLIPEAFSRQLADGIPAAEFVRLPGVGHFAYMEHSGQAIPPIVEFLSRSTQ